MKPLPAAPLTTEDLDIWSRALMEWTMHRTPGWLRLGAQESDRRDARLMLAWAPGWPIDLGGDDENGECLFWRKWPTFGFEQA